MAEHYDVSVIGTGPAGEVTASHIELRDGTVAVHDGPAAGPDVVLESDRHTVLAWGTGRLSDRDALETGLRIDGGGRELARFRRLFDPAQRGRAA